jgi:hypothetical protein
MLLDGHDLQSEFGLLPGPRVGDLLEAVREAQATGQVQTREAAMFLVQSMLSKSEEARGGEGDPGSCQG